MRKFIFILFFQFSVAYLFAQGYSVTPLPDIELLQATALNDSTQVCGFIYPYRSFVWENGNLSYIPDSTRAISIDNYGRVCGYAWVGIIQYSFIYENGVTTLISPLSGERCNATDINNNGTIVGRTTIGQDNNVNRPFIYNGSTMKDIGTFGGPQGSALGINDSGWVVGKSLLNESVNSEWPFVYKGSGLEQLPIPPGATKGTAKDINNAYEICGYSAGNIGRAIKWDKSGNVSVLPILSGTRSSSAYSINDQGDIVGFILGDITDSLRNRAVLWRGNEIIILEDEIDPNLSLVLMDAYDINNRGQILCRGGEYPYRYYILSPIDTTKGFIVNMTGDESDADLNDGVCDIDLNTGGNQCTMRAAIEQVIFNGGTDKIAFDISGSGVPTIMPESPLPEIRTTMKIDGTTQPGSGFVELIGNSAGGAANGLEISSDDCEIKGLIINKFSGDGIKITGNGNTIIGNIIGTNKNSLTDLGNGKNGISIINASDNIIGNPSVDELNIIAANKKNGIYITGSSATGNQIKSNYIGTDIYGTDGLGNGEAGIKLEKASSGNQIGVSLQQSQSLSQRAAIGLGNIIARNGVGVKIFNTKDAKIIGNTIGLYVSPIGENISKLGSFMEGILIKDSENTEVSECTIGGTGGDGIRITGELSKYNKIFNTFIGTDADGKLDIGCEGNGICIDSLAKGNFIGGCGEDSIVTIAGNKLSGILLKQAALLQAQDSLLNYIRNTQIGVMRNLKQGSYKSAKRNGKTSKGGFFLKIPNGLSGITIDNSILTKIGEIWCPNTISGNSGAGILIKGILSHSNKIFSNFIGTTNQGDEDLGNKGDGIRIEDEANKNVIGGELDNVSNVISGNLLNGIALINADRNKIVGNIMGMFRQYNDESVQLGNKGNGVYLKDSFRNIIRKCLISANEGNGIHITGSSSQFNKVFDVIIGSDSSASQGLGNGKNGIIIENMAGGNTIGGIGRDSSVTIVGSSKYGILMKDLLSDLKNIIHNTNMGIARSIKPQKNKNNISSKNNKRGPFNLIPNSLGGLHLSNSMNTIIGSALSPNLIAGNLGPGITLEGFSTMFNKLIGNIIGTDTVGTPNMGNLGDAIKLINGAHDNFIGGENSGESNICVGSSGNGFGIGISLSNTYNNKISSMMSGIFKRDGQLLKILSNDIGILIDNSFGTIIKSSVFSGNILDGAKISGTGSHNISIIGSVFGTDFSGTKALGNKRNGITIEKGANNITIGGSNPSDINILNSNGGFGLFSVNASSLNLSNLYTGADAQGNIYNKYGNDKGGLSFLNCIDAMIGGAVKNISAAFNFAAISMINTTGSVENNIISTSNTGVSVSWDSLMSKLKNVLKIQKNIIRNCNRAIQTNDIPGIYISGNLVDGNVGVGSGIHMYNSGGTIEGNTFSNDAGDAIFLEDGSNPIVTENNIINNEGFGLRNESPSIVINAESNWWGDASGPSGIGTGSGDGVSADVDYQNWKSEVVSLVILGGQDTTYQTSGTTDTVMISVLNWSNPTDVVDITLKDSEEWLTGKTSFTVAIDDSVGNAFPVVISIPSGTAPNVTTKVIVQGVSQKNASHTNENDFYVTTYTSELQRIIILPDSVVLTVGDSLQFTVLGYDQLYQPVDFYPEWSTDLGTIDNTGLYYTPSTSGVANVTVTDPVTGLIEKAIVVVKNPTEVKENKGNIPKEYWLSQNYPNPFNPSTVIKYSIPSLKTPVRGGAGSGLITLKIYDILGRVVTTLVNERQKPGNYEVQFDASSLASGIYFYQLRAGTFAKSRKMLLLK